MKSKKQITMEMAGAKRVKLFSCFEYVLDAVERAYPTATREGSAGGWSWIKDGVVVAASTPVLSGTIGRHWLAMRNYTANRVLRPKVEWTDAEIMAVFQRYVSSWDFDEELLEAGRALVEGRKDDGSPYTRYMDREHDDFVCEVAKEDDE